MPQVALSSHLVHLLPSLPEQQRQKVVQALKKIHHDQFDSGLRVKKLQSRPEVAVWEARVSDAGRLLFTYGRHADRRSEEPTLTAHCWTVVMDHDDVPRELRRKAFDVPEAMQWILADEVDACTWTDTLPDNPAADLEAIERDFSAAERWNALGALSDEYDPTLTAPPENLPWYLESPAIFEEWADANEIPAELILSDEQVHLLHQPLPTFLNGPAGSGKTTLALYRLLVLQEENPDAPLAFVTHNPRLVVHAQELYEALPERPADARPVDFSTYQALVAESLGWSDDQLQRRMAHPNRLRFFLSHFPLSSTEKQLFAQDIRAVIKGMLPLQDTPARASDVSPLLPREVYRSMPEGWAAVPKARRDEVYDLANKYQQDLADREQWDDQDAATHVLCRLLDGTAQRRYRGLVLDEVQDLTEKQLRVALATLQEGYRDRLLLAGDPTQTLGGSGFGWRMPRAIFHERGWPVPEPYTLHRSYRATAPTLRLPQALAELLKAQGGEVVALDPEQARAQGPPPVRTAPSEAVDKALSEERPNVLILTDTELRAARLRERLGHPFVWSVAEAKGLEADHVVMYRMDDQLQDQAGAAPADRESIRQTNRHILRLHYVAATRARRSVTAVVDPDPVHSLWDTDAVAPTTSTLADFRPPWAGDPTGEEWLERARYYRDRNQWAQAAEAYRKGGRDDWATICTWFASQHQPSEEASRDASVAMTPAQAETLSPKQAAFVLEHGGGAADRPLRIALLRRAGRTAAADRLQAALDEDEGRFAAAAAYYRAQGNHIRAARLCQQAGAYEDAAQCYADAGQWARAAECYQTVEDWRAAAACYRADSKWLAAARQFEKAGAWHEAATDYENVRQWDAAGRCYENAEAWHLAGDAYRRAAAWDAAATCYDAADAPRWATICSALSTHGPTNEALEAIRHAHESLTPKQATYLLTLDCSAGAVMRAWLRACTGAAVESVRVGNLRYNGGGWYVYDRWDPDEGVVEEKVQGADNVPDVLAADAPRARRRHSRRRA
ncbi:AAA family ATPase [Salisaeta longa]|uniref:AAA family ATPase n=1 Tax=Salisaeta longa TaxID=503170 RepID=UPI0003FDC23C|nr:AAA family ATPase [Salisaeta longa]